MPPTTARQVSRYWMPRASSQANTCSPDVRGARWQQDEEEWVLERFAEDPNLQWRDLIGPFNAHFASRPPRNTSAMRQHFRLWRSQLQMRLNAQRGVGEELVESDEGESEDEEEEDIKAKADMLFKLFDDIMSRKKDCDDEGRGGSGKRGPGAAGAPIAARW